MQSKRSSCLVTGGAGFIGSHLADRLVSFGHDVRVVDNLSTGDRENISHLSGRIDFLVGDLCDPGVCARAVADVDVVFHVAALPSVPRSLADPWGSHDSNVNATVRLLQACQSSDVKRVVYSSSSSVYGDTPQLPKEESMELVPRSPYAASKLSSEQYVLAFARSGIIEGVALRYFNVFGPRQSPDSPYAAVIPLFLRAALHNMALTVYGDGTQTRDFTFVDNVVEGNILAASRPASVVNGVAVNMGAGVRTSLLELIALVQEVTGVDLVTMNVPPRAGDVRDSQASLERASAVLGYAPGIDLLDGLSRTWAWMTERAGIVADARAGGTTRAAAPAGR